MDGDWKSEEDELHFLRWFYQNVDFGPAHSDCMMYLFQCYEEEYGPLPESVKEGY